MKLTRREKIAKLYGSSLCNCHHVDGDVYGNEEHFISYNGKRGTCGGELLYQLYLEAGESGIDLGDWFQVDGFLNFDQDEMRYYINENLEDY